MDISYRSDLCDIGANEDGERVIAEVYYVYVELSDGSRYEHGHRFPSMIVNENDLGWGFEDVSDAAVAKVEALLERIEKAGEASLDLKFWYALDPAYGSAAYQSWEAQASTEELGYCREEA